MKKIIGSKKIVMEGVKDIFKTDRGQQLILELINKNIKQVTSININFIRTDSKDYNSPILETQLALTFRGEIK